MQTNTNKILVGLLAVCLICFGVFMLFKTKNTPTVSLLTPTTTASVSNNTPVEYARDVYNWKTYIGAWFEIDYPSDFIIAESIASPTLDATPTLYDSVYFYTNDKSAYFYVYSPQWNGTPNDIKILPGEKIISQNKEVYNNKTETTLVTIYGNDQAERIVRDTTDPESNVHYVTIFKYQKGDRFKFENDYTKFYNSLTQLAD